MREIFLAKEEYLDAAFSAIDGQYGSADAFLCAGLNIPDEKLDRFRSAALG